MLYRDLEGFDLRHDAERHESIRGSVSVEDPKVSILIVGYNSARYLVECIGSIDGALSRHSYEVLFVNNGTDNSERVIAENFPWVRILPAIGNVGFASGNDYLAEHARGVWLLLLNPDTRLYPAAVDVLVDTAERYPQYEVVGGLSVSEEGVPAPAIRLPTLGTLLQEILGRTTRTARIVDTSSELVEVDAVSGGFMMVRRDCWDRLGGLDQSFFLYAEELDFFKRLKEDGGRVGQVAASRMYHDIGSGSVFSPDRIRFKTLGNAHYFRKHSSKPYACSALLLMWLSLLVRYAGGRLLASRDEKYAKMSRGYSLMAKSPRIWVRGYDSPGADPRDFSSSVGDERLSAPSN